MMDGRLLDYYSRELSYLRELGAEFAAEYPKIAGRLGMRDTEVVDPYVERLLEGFSFLAARIHLKMDAEFPRFSQRLLELVYPGYLSPLPAMAIVQIPPDLDVGNLASGYALPAGTALRANVTAGEQTPCEFRTSHEVTLWPIRIASIRMEPAPEDLPAAFDPRRTVRSVLRIRLETDGAVRFRDLPLERLSFFLGGQPQQAQHLLRLLLGQSVVAAVVRDPESKVPSYRPLPADAIRHEGFASGQALLPDDLRSFSGHRILHEYFAYPSRLLFFSIGGLRDALRQTGTACELLVLFDERADDLYRSVDARSLALYCTPAANLFPKRTDRMPVSRRQHEYHIVADRSRPLDYEIYRVNRVLGHGGADGREQEFLPFYSTHSRARGNTGCYFSTRREPRLASARQRGHQRSEYAGSELFVTLVDQQEAPYSGELRHVSVEALCTNRDLAILMPLGARSDFTLTVSAPAGAIKVLKGPTVPRASIAENEITWRLISHLGLNYLTLTDLDGAQGASALRELLGLYADLADPALVKQIQGIHSVRVEPVYRALPHPGPIMHGRGVCITVLIEEAVCDPYGMHLFGTVLDQFFARHVSLNSFSELVIETLQKGEIGRWKPRIGCRPTA
jgi:type VI secretion system protein ImpG